jgi:hypothetical protein
MACRGETPRVCGICEIPLSVLIVMLNFPVELSNLTLREQQIVVDMFFPLVQLWLFVSSAFV